MKLEYRDRGTSGTQLDVMSGSIVVCRLWKAMQSNDAREESWQWTWSMDRGPPDFRTFIRPTAWRGHCGGLRAQPATRHLRALLGKVSFRRTRMGFPQRRCGAPKREKFFASCRGYPNRIQSISAVKHMMKTNAANAQQDADQSILVQGPR